jgi:hypothetical protein
VNHAEIIPPHAVVDSQTRRCSEFILNVDAMIVLHRVAESIALGEFAAAGSSVQQIGERSVTSDRCGEEWEVVDRREAQLAAEGIVLNDLDGGPTVFVAEFQVVPA